MQKKVSIPVFLISLLTVAVLVFMLAYVALDANFKAEKKSLDDAYKEQVGEIKEQYSEFDKYTKLLELDDIFRNNYIGDIDDGELVDMVLRGYVAGTGDKYGDYYTAEEMEELLSDLDGNVKGIGVSVIYNADIGAIEILNVMPDSPAEKYGLLPGDLIVGVGNGDDAVSVASLGYDIAVSRIRGEVGTNAEFVILRDGEYIDCSVTRAEVTEQTVMSHVYALDGTVGVIRITSFDKKTYAQFVNAVADMKKAGCTSLVVDLRNNPGGELGAICSVLDFLLPEGPIVRTVDKAGNEQVIAESTKACLGMPMSVVVNGSTASAAELFTSAVMDYKIATVVGTKTYGKGCMQTIGYLSDGSGYRITYRMYNPPFSDNYDGIGITPDQIVELDPALEKINPYKYTDEEDNQLAAAVAALKK